jgi:hypothetical protein
MSSRHKSWHFASILTVPPDVAQSITSDPQCSEDAIKRVLTSQILSRTDVSRPDSIFKIELRYKLSDLNGSCSVLPVAGYVQSKIPLAHYRMEKWFQAQWSPVGGRCSCAPAYIVFCEPDPNYIRLFSHCATRLPTPSEEDHPRKKGCVHTARVDVKCTMT